MLRGIAGPAAALVALAGLAHCGPPTTPGRKEPVAKTMQDHFGLLIEVKESVAAGERHRAVGQADSLQERLAPEDYPRRWREEIELVRGEIGKITKSPDLDAAALHTARAAARCGACHTELGIDATEPAPMPAGKGGGRDEYMLRHQAATDNLWRGLVGPSDEAWTVGAGALAELGALPDGTANPEFAERAAQLERLGSLATAAKDSSARAAVYGEFLASCHGCHLLFRD